MTPILVNKDKIYTFISRHPCLVGELKTIFAQIPKYFPTVLNIIVKLREVDPNNYTDYDDLWIHVILPENEPLIREKWHLLHTECLAAGYLKTGSLFRVEYYFPYHQEDLLTEVWREKSNWLYNRLEENSKTVDSWDEKRKANINYKWKE